MYERGRFQGIKDKSGRNCNAFFSILNRFHYVKAQLWKNISKIQLSNSKYRKY